MRVGGVVCVQHWPSTCEVLKVLFRNKKNKKKAEGGKERKKMHLHTKNIF